MKGNKGKKGQKKVTNNKFKGKKVSNKSNSKKDKQYQNKNGSLIISPNNLNEITSPIAIFDYKGNLTYIQCNIMDDMKFIFEKFAFAIKQSITNFCFKINDIIIDFKSKFKDFVINGNIHINISVSEINEADKTKFKNYITVETIVDEKILINIKKL